MKALTKLAVVAAGLVAGCLSAQNAGAADVVIVNNLATSASNVSGLKNSINSSYYQDFDSTVTGDLNSLQFDLGLQSTTGNSGGSPMTSGNTATFYLYSVNNNGTPIAKLATLTSAITGTAINSGGSSIGYTQNNDSFVYDYSVSPTLLSNPALTASTDYAVVMSLSGSTQDIGWAEETGGDAEPTGEVGKLGQVGQNTGVGYGRMEVDAVPEPASWMLGAVALVLAVGLRVRYRRSA